MKYKLGSEQCVYLRWISIMLALYYFTYKILFIITEHGMLGNVSFCSVKLVSEGNSVVEWMNIINVIFAIQKAYHIALFCFHSI